MKQTSACNFTIFVLKCLTITYPKNSREEQKKARYKLKMLDAGV